MCEGGVQPRAETCNGLDDDCDGSTDEDPVDPQIGDPCGTDEGECRSGNMECRAGRLVCDGSVGPVDETCNGLDDDCDGLTDEDPTDPDIGEPCGSDQGQCQPGQVGCMEGRLTCVGGVQPSDETCNGLDDDCDGITDEDPTDPDIGEPCGSDQGQCRPGAWECDGAQLVCMGAVGPTDEECNGLDDDCDGHTDEGVCAGNPQVESIRPGDGWKIDASEAIVITFDRSMDPSSLTLGGDVGSQDTAVAWSGDAHPGDTLTISPSPAWDVGQLTLVLDCDDEGGHPIDTFRASFIVVPLVVYVHPEGSDDSPGTMDAPLRTIQAGIAMASGTPGSLVRVAQGDYESDSSSGDMAVMIPTGVSLEGGYCLGDWFTRDPDVCVTSVTDTAQTNSFSRDYPRYAVGMSYASRCSLDGFTLFGGDTRYSAALYLNGAGCDVTNNELFAGQGVDSSYAAYVRESQSTLTGNRIHGPEDGPTYAYGVYLKGGSSTLERSFVDVGRGTSLSAGVYVDSGRHFILDSEIHGGQGSKSYGIYQGTDYHTTIRGNAVFGEGGPDTTESHGIYVAATLYNLRFYINIVDNFIDGGRGSQYSFGIKTSLTVEIANNAIQGGTSRACYGIHSTQTDSKIWNNIIYAGNPSSYSYGIYCHGSNTPDIWNNTIHNGQGGQYRYGIYLFLNAMPSITNNIIMGDGESNGRSYCVYEDVNTSGSDPSELRSNDLFGCPTGLYHDRDRGCSGSYDCHTAAQVNGLGDIPQNQGNLDAEARFESLGGADHDPGTLSDDDWGLSATCPCSVTRGGVDLSGDYVDEGTGYDLSEEFTMDRRGVVRTAPWSVGALERDGACAN